MHFGEVLSYGGVCCGEGEVSCSEERGGGGGEIMFLLWEGGLDREGGGGGGEGKGIKIA